MRIDNNKIINSVESNLRTKNENLEVICCMHRDGGGDGGGGIGGGIGVAAKTLR